MVDHDRWDVVVVGDGVAGRTAGLFAARHGLDALVVGTASPILRRNAHLENYPGFPAGVDARLLLDMMADQAERAGCVFADGEVVRVDEVADGEGNSGREREGDGGSDADPRFVVETAAGERWHAAYVVAATKNAVDYLAPLDGVEIRDRGKTFVETDERGRTGVEGLYAAGRLAGKPHQAVVAAGHGAEVAVTLLEDDERPFYHDWVTPDGYFTDRDRDVPPGCEEIDEAEHRRRERESLAALGEYVAEPHPETPDQHPSVADRE